MKKRYIALIILLAMICTAGVSFAVYKNWSAILDIVNFAPKKPKEVKLPVIQVPPVKPVDAKVVLNVDPSEDVLKERQDIAKREESLGNQATAKFDRAIKTIQAEGNTKQSQAKPLSDIVVENTKQRQTKLQKAASDKYRNLLQQIEIEKAKAAVVLTGTRTEKEKAAKLDALKVDALDMELELYAENRIRNPGARKPLSKMQAEFLVHKGIV